MRGIPIALILFGLASCQSEPAVHEKTLFGAPPSAPDCRGAGAGSNNADCTIKVDVSEANGGCTVRVQDAQREVAFARGASRKWILWQLDGKPAGYKFASDGVNFNDLGHRKSDANSNFTNGQAVANDQIYHWKNRNESSDAGDYGYTVRVVNRDGSISCIDDPLIKNL
jgi:hypothetical protein